MTTGKSTQAEDELARLYRQTILEHARNPIGLRKPIQVTHSSELFNPLCGDRIALSLQVAQGQVLDAAFDGEACAICTASASLLCEQAPGGLVAEFTETQKWLENALQGDDSPHQHQELLPLLGVRRYPSRMRCALLPWEALIEAL